MYHIHYAYADERIASYDSFDNAQTHVDEYLADFHGTLDYERACDDLVIVTDEEE